MKLINLLPKTEQKDLKLYLFSEQLTMFWVWTIISMIFFLGLTYTAKIYLNGQMTEVESQIEQKKLVLKTSENDQLRNQVENLNSQVASIKNLQSQHYYWSAALNELARLLSSDIALDRLDAERSTGKITIEGVAGNRESVLKFWSDIHKSEYFKDINFPLANLNFATDDPFTFTFSIIPEKIKNP